MKGEERGEERRRGEQTINSKVEEAMSCRSPPPPPSSPLERTFLRCYSSSPPGVRHKPLQLLDDHTTSQPTHSFRLLKETLYFAGKTSKVFFRNPLHMLECWPVCGAQPRRGRQRAVKHHLGGKPAADSSPQTHNVCFCVRLLKTCKHFIVT